MAEKAQVIKSDKEKSAEKTKQGDVINLRDKVTVYSKDKDPHHATGTAIQVHPKQAQALYKRGFVSLQPETAKDDKFKGEAGELVKEPGNEDSSNGDLDI
jgi:hypothetical protein